MNLLPSTFKPMSAADFIGGAHFAALQLEKAVTHATRHGKNPLKFLCNGEPGTGKSALALYFQHLLGCNKWSTTKLNGTQVKLEVVEELDRTLATSSLFSEWRLLWVDEADKIPTIAQVRLLTLLDDLPKGAAVFFTSNCALKDFEPRFASRFQTLIGPNSQAKLDPPTQTELAALLRRFTDNADAIKQISTFACGNVRQALLDTEGLLQLAA